jgi:hypothetical protein
MEFPERMSAVCEIKYKGEGEISKKCREPVDIPNDFSLLPYRDAEIESIDEESVLALFASDTVLSCPMVGRAERANKHCGIFELACIRLVQLLKEAWRKGNLAMVCTNIMLLCQVIHVCDISRELIADVSELFREISSTTCQDSLREVAISQVLRLTTLMSFYRPDLAVSRFMFCQPLFLQSLKDGVWEDKLCGLRFFRNLGPCITLSLEAIDTVLETLVELELGGDEGFVNLTGRLLLARRDLNSFDMPPIIDYLEALKPKPSVDTLLDWFFDDHWLTIKQLRSD